MKTVQCRASQSTITTSTAKLIEERKAALNMNIRKDNDE